MRILMTADAVGGVWTYALELAAALAPHDVHVTLAVMGPSPSAEQERAAAALPNLELVAKPFALEWMPEPWSDVDAAGDWLLGHAQRIRANVVHVNGYAHAALPFQAPVLSVAHSCACSWYRAVRGAEAPEPWDEYRRRVARGLRAADAVAAPTAAILQAIQDAHHVSVRGHVIPHGRSGELWAPGSEDPFILAAGRMWDQAKGLTDLAACAPRVPWPIRVAGPTTPPALIADEVEMRGVELLGELAPAELAKVAARAAIYALPARYEPFGMSIVEAALAGCALVVGDIPTLREIWGDTATYVRPGDTDALASALNGLITDESRRTALAHAARARALELTPAKMAASYVALYRELATAKPAEVCA